MPTYEYKREDGSTFEVIQKMSEDPLTVCPTTGQKVKRVISGGGGVVYKGEGWYVTDYKNGGKEAGNNSSKEATSSESKPEPKKETTSKENSAKSES
ncbi:MAG: zinc ribbon domain-containing protein [Balneolaceae bacterium]|nr:zinc ribbon domain-containing protein [Balneolaceae bacterium]MBO6545205.1 zinc ribbon domain-containing protein [Balneolaceae bacterium]MBO6646601.1 zinc ribbon domain-containing protein [Balneolaceae bacterium]